MQYAYMHDNVHIKMHITLCTYVHMPQNMYVSFIVCAHKRYTYYAMYVIKVYFTFI